MNRLQTLKARHERLINANYLNHYTQLGNPKIDKYYKCLLAIKKEKMNLQCENIHPIKRGLVTNKLFFGFESEIEIIRGLN